jgi:hypothetical protein
VKPIKLTPDSPPVKSAAELAAVITSATDAQVADKPISDPEGYADFLLSTDTLNYHRLLWRLTEEWGEVEEVLGEKVAERICRRRGYDREEFDAALVATAGRPRLPYGMTAMDLATRRMRTRPVRLLDAELEESRYARGVLTLAIHLQELQKEEPILLPVEQVRELLGAKKVVVSGTISKLIQRGLLELTKPDYHTGSAREFRFRGVEGRDYEFLKPCNGQTAGVKVKSVSGEK